MLKRDFLQFFEIKRLTGKALANSILNGNIKIIFLLTIFDILVFNYITLTADKFRHIIIFKY